MRLDVEAVRRLFPALAEGTAYFDGPGGTQVPSPVADEVARTMTSGVSNRGTLTVSERRAEGIVAGARGAVADLLGCDAGGVVFARSMTQATYDVSRALAKQWAAGDEVVVTRLDHDANIRPWLQAAASAGAEVRWAGFDRVTGELTVDDVRAELLAADQARRGHRRLERPGHATRPPGDRRGRARGGCAAVRRRRAPDPARPGRRRASSVRTSSPARRTSSSARTTASSRRRRRCGSGSHPDKLLASTDAVPERFELGTLPYELLAGTTAAVELIAGLASRRAGTVGPPGRVLASMRAVEEHEDGAVRPAGGRSS